MESIDAHKAHRLLQMPDTVIIDIRGVDEYQQEHIPKSLHCPCDAIDDFHFEPKAQTTAIFHCQIGKRTQMYSQQLKALGFKDSYCLEGGLNAWKAAGFDTNK